MSLRVLAISPVRFYWVIDLGFDEIELSTDMSRFQNKDGHDRDGKSSR